MRVAVVGHTNTGKTSLLRTLTRDVSFGTVSNRPATTRRVEGASLLVNGERLVDLYDTPGLEDSIGLLALLERVRGDLGLDRVDALARFLQSEEALGEYAQEARALAQVRRSDIALYVIDARDAVLGKYRDELEILGRCSVPVVPVMNFVAGAEARVAKWREHLARAGLHAVAQFDTVALDSESEYRLYETMIVMAARFRPTLETVLADLDRRRSWLIRASAELLADLLVDAAAYAVNVRSGVPERAAEAIESLQGAIRRREQRFVDEVLALHAFRAQDYQYTALPLEDGVWGADLFNPETLARFGIKTGSAAAVGAAAGLAVDAAVGGITLGAAAATGAALGAALGAARDRGRDLYSRLRGYSPLRVDMPTLTVLVVRNATLVAALFRRGHASRSPLRIERDAEKGQEILAQIDIVRAVRKARPHPEWSRIETGVAAAVRRDGGRAACRDRLAESIEPALRSLSSAA